MLAGVLGGCARVPVLVSPLLSWPGFVVCAVGLGFWLAPLHSWLDFPGRAWLCARSACTPLFLARVCGVCLSSGFGCAPPLLAGFLGCVCVCVRAPFVLRNSWLGCAVWSCVLGLGLRLRPATPGWGVGMCVCLCARSACTLLVFAEVCGLGVCAWAGVFGCALPLLAALL